MSAPHTSIAYLVYLAVTIAMTIWVARTLFRNGRVFLVRALGENEELADSVNRLLVVGFYLVNLGYIAMALESATKPVNLQESIEFVSWKIGLVAIVLGSMHFLNLYIFSRVWRHRSSRRAAPSGPDYGEIGSPEAA